MNTQSKIKNKNLMSYLDYTKQPWGKLFYKIIWEQLPILENKTVLDFGSGFGITANHLAKSNSVTAIEPSTDMLRLGCYQNNINLINGGFDHLKKFPDNYFDVIICHNVLEYADNREKIMAEFLRVLRNDGFISIVKHNKMGRIMQKAIFDCEYDKVKMLLNNVSLNSSKFGEIRIYDDDSITDYSKGKLEIEKCYGVCTFYGLQNNDIKFKKIGYLKCSPLSLRYHRLMSLETYHFSII